MRTAHFVWIWPLLLGRAWAAGIIPPPAVPLSGGALPGPFTLYYGASALSLGANGTAIGMAGASVTVNGPSLDGTAIRFPLSGTNYTVPTGVSLVRFTQTGTISAQTVLLPNAVGDTHPIEFDNYAGAVNAYSFSPAVLGWVNGSTLPAGVSIRIRWDATDNTWHRIG